MRKRIEKFLLWCGLDDIGSEMLSWFISVGILIALGIQLAWGIYDANDADKCHIYSIKDFAYTPGYALGCNIAKKRFDVKLNP